MDNDNLLQKHHSFTTDQDFYISSGYYSQEYNMENDHRKIKQIRIYSCLGIDPDDPKTDILFPDTQFVFSINGNLIKKFSFIHNGNGIIYSRYSSIINIEYIDPCISNNFRDGIDEPWTKTFCKCFAVVFFENNIEENNTKNNKIVEIHDKEEIQEKTKQITELFMDIANKQHKTLEEVVEVYYKIIQDNTLYN